MNGLAQLILREVGTRRQVFLLAAMMALLPFLFPLLPGMTSYDPPILRAAVALSLAAGFTLALALILGSTMIGRDLSEGRFGFYLSRPLSGVTVWAGKMTGVLILIAAVALIVLAPTFLGTLLPGADAVRGRSVFLEVFQTPSMPFILGGVLLLLVLAHALSVLARAQSPWIVVPIVAGIAAAAVALHLGTPLATLGDAFYISFLMLMGNLLLSLLLAGLLQVVLGRADLKRGARVLALVFSCGLLVSTSIHAGYAAWVKATEPGDLQFIHRAMAGGEGSWVYLSGQVERGGTRYSQSFLIDTDSGRWLRTGQQFNGLSNVAFTPDGGRAIWVRLEAESLSGGPVSRIWTVDLDQPDSRPELVLSLDSLVRTVALSPGGERLALVMENDLQVYELDSGRPLAAARTCRELRGYQIIFLGPDLVRFYRTAPAEEVAGLLPGMPEGQVSRRGIVIAELDVAQGTFHRSGVIPRGADGLHGAAWSRDAERMTLLLRYEESGSFFLHDGRTGELIMPLGPKYKYHMGPAWLLFDGRIVTLREAEDQTELVVLSSEGIELQAIRIDEGWSVLDGEVAPGVLALRIYQKSGFSEQGDNCYLVDLDAGHCRHLGQRLRPVMGVRGIAGTFGAWPSPGSPGSQLFIENHSCLVRLDPWTGERQVLLQLEPWS